MKKLIGILALAFVASLTLSSCKTSQVGTSGSTSGKSNGTDVDKGSSIQDILAGELVSFRLSPEHTNAYEDFSNIKREDPRLITKPSGPLSSSNDIAQAMDVKLSQLRSARQSIDKMYGYRILIYSGGNATKANEYVELLEEMMEMDPYSGEQLLPKLPILFDYHEPNYVVKIGNYLSRLEAHHQYIALDKEEFPQSIVISEPIPFRNNSQKSTNSNVVAPPATDDE